MERTGLGRREMLLGLGAALGGALVGCSGDETPVGPSSTPPTPPTPPPTASSPGPRPTPDRGESRPPSRPALPAPAPWAPAPRDSAPDVKQAAVDVLVAAGTYDSADGTTLGRRLAGSGPSRFVRRALARSGFAAGAPRAASGIRVAQMGGLLPDTACVMTVVEQRTDTGLVDRTFDVRLTRRAGHWVVTDVHVPPTPPPRARPSEQARKVLSSHRVRLPAAAVADVRGGLVDERLLELLLALGRTTTLDVTVLVSGHPQMIFDKPQVSDHAVGRAADVWAIDGEPVVRAPRRSVLTVMERAVDLGAYQVGGPWDPGPRAAPYYTDAVHQDHLHLGVPRA